jgi:tripartite-type tricarboxylate transporter receptor subunit TctC
MIMKISRSHVRHAIVVLGLVLAISFALPAFAEFPERPITLVVPRGAGGGTDTFGRSLADALSKVLPVPVSVVNRPGAGGFVGAQQVATSRPDGYMILVHSYGQFMMAALRKKPPVHPLDDLTILGEIGELYTGMVIRKDDDRFSNLEEFKTWAKKNPNFTFGFPGKGSWHNVSADVVNKGLGIKGRPVSFKGGAHARSALLGGQVDIAWIGVQQMAGFESKLKLLMVNSEERYPFAKGTPTIKEKGIPYTLVTSPIVLCGPAGLDAVTVAKLDAAIKQAVQSEDYKKKLEKNLAVARYLNSKDARAYLTTLWKNWGELIKAK